MIAFLLLASAVIFFFSSSEKLRRYIAYAFGGLALIAVVIMVFTVQTGTKSNAVTGSEKAVVESTILEQEK
ncbi:hypothetical protein J7E78_02765 [Paenibacillus polymyxa]|uniref:hypothetical protein n=1 Tax=Paenibacillus polymyxa TaxID=1406 RepID=UPI001BEB1A80|nr:hypothetical protein [Paenibacillus polymyxa]MBT2282474.1 hypothetical protein [Paenibacillus polymyxa]